MITIRASPGGGLKLQAKVLVLFVMTAILCGGLTVGLSWRIIGAIVTRQLAETGLNKASELAKSAMDDLQAQRAQSEAWLLPALESAQQATGASYALALDAKNVVLAHTEASEKGKRYEDPVSLALTSPKAPKTLVHRRGKTLIMDIAVPVWTKASRESSEQFLLGGKTEAAGEQRWLGAIRLGLPLEPALKTRTRILQKIILIISGVGVAALLAALWIIRGIIVPVRLLAWATGRISRGEYGTEVPVRSKDELGDLAKSFNKMSRVLAETTVSKNFLECVLSNLTDLLIVLAADGTIRLVNQSTLRLLGYEPEELKGRPARLLFMEDHRFSAGLDDDVFVGKRSVQNMELDMLAKTGAKIPVLFSCSALKDAEGRPDGVIATAVDMTERKRLEKVIRQSEKMSAVGQLAAGVAHEINNPLGVILGFAETLASDVRTGDPQELAVKSIEREANRCKDLVQDLLTFSRASRADREPMDLNAAVGGAISLIHAKARIAKVDVQATLGADLPRILGNLTQLQEVIINLANNAIDAMPKGGSLGIVTELHEEAPRSWVCLRIIDNGSGIPPEVLPRIFEPFFTTKPVGKGTGLGLSLVYEIVQKHSGTIDVHSWPGCTEFLIKFPVRTGREMEEQLMIGHQESGPALLEPF